MRAKSPNCSACLEVQLSKRIVTAFTPTFAYEPALLDTAKGTIEILRDIGPQLETGIDPLPNTYVKLGAQVLFAGNGTEGNELWITDGTSVGTQLLANIAPGIRSSNPAHMVEANGRVLFSATTISEGEELWVTDGTIAGTKLVMDIVVGAGGSQPHSIEAFKDGVIFVPGGGGVWFSNGLTAIELTENGGGFGYGERAVLSDRVIFSRPMRPGAELWISDGSPSGTQLVFGNENPFGMFRIHSVDAAAGIAFFRAELTTGECQLWSTNGTLAGTGMVFDFGREFPPSNVASNSSFFVFSDEYGVYSSDGSVDGTKKIVEFGPSDFFLIGMSNGRYEFFLTATPIAENRTTQQLWVTDGTLQGTRLLIASGAGTILGFDGSRVILNVSDDELGQTVRVVELDGTVAEVILGDAGSTNAPGLAVELVGSADADVLRGGSIRTLYRARAATTFCRRAQTRTG